MPDDCNQRGKGAGAHDVFVCPCCDPCSICSWPMALPRNLLGLALLCQLPMPKLPRPESGPPEIYYEQMPEQV